MEENKILKVKAVLLNAIWYPELDLRSEKKKKKETSEEKKKLLKYKVVVELIMVYQFLILTIALSVCEILLEEPDWMIHMKLYYFSAFLYI